MSLKVKICGITRIEDGRLALSLGADELGFVLAPSPRRIGPEALKSLLEGLRGEGRLPSFRAIGVFVNEDARAMRDIIAFAGLDAAQAHGDETPSDCAAFDFPWYRALRIGSVADASRLVPAGWDCPRLLIDSASRSSYGGTGKSVGSWAALAARAFARSQGKEFFIAGGIGPRNAASVIYSLSPDGIDVSSGVEEGPGRKSRDKLEALFGEIARAEAAVEAEKEPTMRRDERYYGRFGGRFVPEVLRPAFVELEAAWNAAREDGGFWAEIESLGRGFVGRPTPLCLAERLSGELGLRLYLKLEGLANTGAHKINNALGQALLAKRMGKVRLIAETGAGQHGLATAAAAAKLGLECEVFMGEVDMARQHPNVFGMRMFGAKVTPVREGTRTLTDAVNAAMKNWTERVADTHYVLGSALGAHPYPAIVRELQSVIGKEIKAQIIAREGRLPDRIYACVGGGSNSIGAFSPFLDEDVRLVGAEAGGRGEGRGMHATRMGGPGRAGQGRVGIVQAYKSFFLQDGDGSLLPTHSVSAGLDYAGIGPQLAYLGETGRVRFDSVLDDEVLAAVSRTARAEGILPALESAHALALLFRDAETKGVEPGSLVVVNVSGRGDKDLFITAPRFDREDWLAFLESEVSRIKKGEL